MQKSAVILVSFFSAMALGFVFRCIGIRTGIVAVSRYDRWHHPKTISILGGPAILLSAASWLESTTLVILSAFCVFGLIDDIIEMPTGCKALALIFPCALASWMTGHWWTGLLCWIIANAVNLLDHADTIAAVTSLTSIAFSGNQNAGPLVGSCMGFLFHNFPPARMFMGDSGSLMLGTAIVLTWMDHGPMSVVCAAIVPLLEMTFVSVRRMTDGKKPWTGGTDHSGHILLRMGVPPQFLPLIYTVPVMVSCFFAWRH